MKRDISMVIGNVIDRYDTSLYGFLAPIMGPIFFPYHDPVVQLILVYATSVAALISKPLGTFIFGMIASHKGPSYGLSYSLIGVAVATMCIGCIPRYEVIGCGAPLLLFFLRTVRGICAAGENTIAKLSIMEDKSDEHALFISHIYQSSSMMGIVIASFIATMVITFNHHWWRVCFWGAGLTGFVGYGLRYYDSGASGVQAQTVFFSYKISKLRLLWINRRDIGCIALVTSCSTITYTIPFVFMNSFIPLVTTISLSTMMALNTGLLVFDMVLIVCIGYVTKRYKPERVLFYAAVILAVSVIPLFAWIANASLWYVTCVRMWIVLWGVVLACPLNFWLNSLFTGHDKYFLVGMGNALGTATLGYMTIPVCLWLWYVTYSAWMPMVYVALVMACTVYVMSVRYNYFIEG